MYFFFFMISRCVHSKGAFYEAGTEALKIVFKVMLLLTARYPHVTYYHVETQSIIM